MNKRYIDAALRGQGPAIRPAKHNVECRRLGKGHDGAGEEKGSVRCSMTRSADTILDTMALLRPPLAPVTTSVPFTAGMLRVEAVVALWRSKCHGGIDDERAGVRVCQGRKMLPSCSTHWSGCILMSQISFQCNHSARLVGAFLSLMPCCQH